MSAPRPAASFGASLEPESRAAATRSILHTSVWRKTRETRNGAPVYERFLIVRLGAAAGRPWRFARREEYVLERANGPYQRIETDDDEDTILHDTLERDAPELATLERETTTTLDEPSLREQISPNVYAVEALSGWHAALSDKTSAPLPGSGADAEGTWFFRNQELPPSTNTVPLVAPAQLLVASAPAAALGETPDGFASASSDGRIYLWRRTGTGYTMARKLMPAPDDEGQITALVLVYVSDGIGASDTSGRLRTWKPMQSIFVRTPTLNSAPGARLENVIDVRSKIVGITSQHTAVAWDVGQSFRDSAAGAPHTPPNVEFEPPASPAYAIASVEDRMFVVGMSQPAPPAPGGVENVVRIYEATREKVIDGKDDLRSPDMERVTALAADPDSDPNSDSPIVAIVAADSAGVVRVWRHIQSTYRLVETIRGAVPAGAPVRLAARHGWLYIGTPRGAISAWKYISATGRYRHVQSLNILGVDQHMLCVLKNGDVVACSGRTAGISVWRNAAPPPPLRAP